MMLTITPEMWFTLYALAKKGALYKKQTMTTRELGDLLGVSQQTASRRIAECVKEGYVHRVHSANGMLLRITEQGKEKLERVLIDLETAFAEPRDKIVIEGIITHGLGEGAYYVDIYADRFEEALGFRPYPGTLNVKVTNDEGRSSVKAMRKMVPLVVTGFVHEGRTFGDVTCYRVRVNGEINAAVVVAQRTHHSTDILEVIAPVNLREELGLEDGSTVTLSVVPLHKAG